jgi:hypothetical protein
MAAPTWTTPWSRCFDPLSKYPAYYGCVPVRGYPLPKSYQNPEIDHQSTQLLVWTTQQDVYRNRTYTQGEQVHGLNTRLNIQHAWLRSRSLAPRRDVRWSLTNLGPFSMIVILATRYV